MKRLLPILLISFLAAPVLGQPRPAWPSTWIGFHACLDLGTFAFDPPPPGDDGFGYKVGIATGMSIDHWFSSDVGLGVELLYVQKGVRSDQQTEFGWYEMSFSYLEIPILFKEYEQ